MLQALASTLWNAPKVGGVERGGKLTDLPAMKAAWWSFASLTPPTALPRPFNCTTLSVDGAKQAIPLAVGPHNPKGESALWIRLGELDLHPVEKGVPELLVMANRLIRPVRCDHLNLLTLDPWADDPNPR